MSRYPRRSALWSDPRVKPPFRAVEIDWGHPLAVKLSSCFLLSDGAGAPIDLASAEISVPLTFPNPPTWASGTNGPYFYCNAATAFGAALDSQRFDVTSDDFSVVVDYYPHSSDTGALLASRGLSFTNGWEFSNGGGYLLFSTYQSGVSQDTDTGSAPLVAGTLTRTVATRSGSSVKIYLNGLDKTSFAASHLDPVTNTRRFSVGNNSGSNILNNGVDRALFYKGRKLTASEVLWLATEPYAFLRPITRRRYFVFVHGPFTVYSYAGEIDAQSVISSDYLFVHGRLIGTLYDDAFEPRAVFGTVLRDLPFAAYYVDAFLVELNGLIACQCAIAGREACVRAMVAALAAQSGINGREADVRALVMALAAQSAVAAREADVKALRGSIAAQSGMAAREADVKALRGSIAAQSAIAGREADIHAAVMALAGQSSIAGREADIRALRGSVAGQSAVAGREADIRAMVAAIIGQSTIAGSIVSISVIQGSVVCQSSVAGTLVVTVSIRGTVAAQSGVAASEAGVHAFAASVAGSSSVASSEADTRAFRATIAGSSTVAADTVFISASESIIVGVTVIDGHVAVTAAILGTVAGQSGVAADYVFAAGAKIPPPPSGGIVFLPIQRRKKTAPRLRGRIRLPVPSLASASAFLAAVPGEVAITAELRAKTARQAAEAGLVAGHANAISKAARLSTARGLVAGEVASTAAVARQRGIVGQVHAARPQLLGHPDYLPGQYDISLEAMLLGLDSDESLLELV